MKAAVYTKTKSGKVLHIIDVERPIPKDNEVLIKTRAASVNPLDWRLKSRRPGVDVAGEVVAAGKRVNQFKPGDAGFGTCRGAFADYACTSETVLVPKPDNLTFDQAACVPIAGLTALQGLRDKGDLQPGQKVLINGAAGGVGTFAAQIATSLSRCTPCREQPVQRIVAVSYSLARGVIDRLQNPSVVLRTRKDVLNVLSGVGNARQLH
jgi:NADPH:quinone reductase-like Zn-dependent oxidoreductase